MIYDVGCLMYDVGTWRATLIPPFVILRSVSDEDVLLNEVKNLENIKENTHVDVPEILRRSAPLNDKNESRLDEEKLFAERLPSREGEGGV